MSADVGRRNARVAMVCSVAVAGMVGLSFAAVPLYNLFCRVTGYGGTTQVAGAAPVQVGDRVITIRFNANTDRSLDWRFAPEQTSIEVRTGEPGLVAYRAENRSDAILTGTATYNVTPDKAGIYFNKIACFCFQEQTLKPGEGIDMPVQFFVDPAIESDPNLRDVTTITLSYTFFKAKDSDAKAKELSSVAPGLGGNVN